ncbi:MAG: superoxide dismutase [Mn] [Candidatus Lightella neohaematopini]|nr:superoxide dismutase [Mn] [Candidatus Lightella neohaematopini]MCV2529029.1 superoxide dismutase [Mn] [Candidatus Lightella neohaematopini]
MNVELPLLPYDYDAMEPFIDQNTVSIHYNKHHKNYVDNANKILANLPEFNNFSLEELLKNINLIPLDKRISLKNNLGGHYNHLLFWYGLKQGTIIDGKIKDMIEYNFGSVNNFKEQFECSALSCFGSGWTWLIKTDNNELKISSTSNQDNPIMGKSIVEIYGYPIFGIDLWEHSYYLKYQNRRIDYIKSFWYIINWDEANNRLNN